METPPFPFSRHFPAHLSRRSSFYGFCDGLGKHEMLCVFPDGMLVPVVEPAAITEIGAAPPAHVDQRAVQTFDQILFHADLLRRLMKGIADYIRMPRAKSRSRTNRKKRIPKSRVFMVDPVVTPKNAKIKRPPNLNDLAVFPRLHRDRSDWI